MEKLIHLTNVGSVVDIHKYQLLTLSGVKSIIVVVSVRLWIKVGKIKDNWGKERI